MKQRDRYSSITSAFVDSVRQEPSTIAAQLEEIDRPVEVHFAIEALKLASVVSAAERNTRCAGDLRVKVHKFYSRRPTPDSDAYEIGPTSSQVAQDVETLGASDHSKPPNPPRWTLYGRLKDA